MIHCFQPRIQIVDQKYDIRFTRNVNRPNATFFVFENHKLLLNRKQTLPWYYYSKIYFLPHVVKGRLLNHLPCPLELNGRDDVATMTKCVTMMIVDYQHRCRSRQPNRNGKD